MDKTDVFEYRADVLPRITFSGRQDTSAKPWRNVRRISEDYIFYFVAEGDIFLEEDGIPIHLTRGDCFLLEPGKLHRGTRYSECSFYYVHFKHADLQKREITEEERVNALVHEHAAWRTATEEGDLPSDRIRIPKRTRVEDRAAFSHLCNMMEQLLNRQRTRMEHFNVLGAHTLSEFFIELTRQSARSVFAAGRGGEGVSERINAVLLYLHTSYMRPMSSADIERELSYNFDYLNQLFAKHLRISIFKLLENVRMEAAKHILQTSALSVKELAGEVGYSDEAYFSKVFKKRTGCKPGEYRKGGKDEDF